MIVDYFAKAKELGRKTHTCPVDHLDVFYTDHFDTDSLCTVFNCKTCYGYPFECDCTNSDPSYAITNSTLDDVAEYAIPF